MQIKVLKTVYHDGLGRLVAGDIADVHESVAKNWGDAVEIIATKVEADEVSTKVEKRKYTKG